MSGRLAVLLGIIGIGAAMGIVGMAQPAAADLVFGATDAGGDCISLVSPAAIGGACSGAGFDLGTNVATWKSTAGSGLTVTSESSAKAGGVVVNQFLEPLPFGGTAQSGIGISPPFGESDNEINNVMPLAVPGLPSGNFVSLLVTNPIHAFGADAGTISIDSLQAGEVAEVCAEPDAHTFGGANCVASTLNGTVLQNLALPAGYSPADPWLAVDAITEPGAVSDVKIDNLDVKVPEPGSLALLLTGMAGLVLALRRRNST
jgi:hypothetical protein